MTTMDVSHLSDDALGTLCDCLLVDWMKSGLDEWYRLEAEAVSRVLAERRANV